MLRWLSLLLLFPTIVVAQQQLVKFEEVEFRSRLERETLQKVLQTGEVTPASFLVISQEDSVSYDQWLEFFDDQMAPLKGRKVKKNKARDVEFLYKELHERFLRKYESRAYFDQIFENGVYNCVTAVALYAVTFEALGVEYDIKETPTHVYLVADPDDSQLLIETTDPVNGFAAFSKTYKKTYVSELVDRKLVDRADMDRGVNEIFDQYYLGSDNITAVQLLGLQYYNKGLQLYDEERYYQAWSALAKAQLFHETTPISNVLFSSLVNHLATCDYSQPRDYRLLLLLPRFTRVDFKPADVGREYRRMLNSVLVNTGDEELADSLFHAFTAQVSDEDIRAEVVFAHNYERSGLLMQRGHFREAFDYAKLAYATKPQNTEAERLLVVSLTMASFNGGPAQTSAIIDSLMITFPNLINNNHFLGLQLNTLLDRMARSFQDRDPGEGQRLQQEFEQAAGQVSEALLDELKVGNAYSAAAVYYFRRNRLRTAKETIKKGLEFAPDSRELQARLAMLSR